MWPFSAALEHNFSSQGQPISWHHWVSFKWPFVAAQEHKSLDKSLDSRKPLSLDTVATHASDHYMRHCNTIFYATIPMDSHFQCTISIHLSALLLRQGTICYVCRQTKRCKKVCLLPSNSVRRTDEKEFPVWLLRISNVTQSFVVHPMRTFLWSIVNDVRTVRYWTTYVHWCDSSWDIVIRTVDCSRIYVRHGRR